MGARVRYRPLDLAPNLALLLTGPSKIAAHCSLRSLAATYRRALQQNASVRWLGHPCGCRTDFSYPQIRMAKIARGALKLLDGEWILGLLPNSGGVVAFRALLISVEVFILAIGIDSYLRPGRALTFDPVAFASTVREHWAWLGAMFGATYAALYSRFAAQWTYLAGLYNQLMAAEEQELRASLPPDRRAKRVLRWAAFIEDAVAMHLSVKASYSSVIATLLSDPEIREEYATSSADEPNRLARLEARLEKALGSTQFQALARPASSIAASSPRQQLPGKS